MLLLLMLQTKTGKRNGVGFESMECEWMRWGMKIQESGIEIWDATNRVLRLRSRSVDECWFVAEQKLRALLVFPFSLLNWRQLNSFNEKKNKG